jgi:hypothetical protein
VDMSIVKIDSPLFLRRSGQVVHRFVEQVREEQALDPGKHLLLGCKKEAILRSHYQREGGAGIGSLLYKELAGSQKAAPQIGTTFQY